MQIVFLIPKTKKDYMHNFWLFFFLDFFSLCIADYTGIYALKFLPLNSTEQRVADKQYICIKSLMISNISSFKAFPD